jgi:hypothetical protein
MAARRFRSIPSPAGALLSVSHRRAEPSLLAHILLATYGRYLPASSRAPPINAGRLGEDAGRNSNGSGMPSIRMPSMPMSQPKHSRHSRNDGLESPQLSVRALPEPRSAPEGHAFSIM